MKKLKILFSMICAIAIISSLCVPAFAYSDGVSAGSAQPIWVGKKHPI